MRVLLATDGLEYSLAAARKCCDLIAFVDTTIRILSIGVKFITTNQFVSVSQKFSRARL